MGRLCYDTTLHEMMLNDMDEFQETLDRAVITANDRKKVTDILKNAYFALASVNAVCHVLEEEIRANVSPEEFNQLIIAVMKSGLTSKLVNVSADIWGDEDE